ncbi:chromosome transmission fidelity protein 8 homolog, partial [Chrysoperla carnea]|uniref:chromosome transmission fidelity protein 8 homolog n=1 Tax=Chrysoperla carnea TaxID=189513 RepID=UPI001D079C48
MIIIKMPDDYQDGSELNSWGMLELQGDLESYSNESKDGKFIGDLHFNKKGIPTLIIGHHILTGKEVPLSKPLAAFVKTTSTSTEATNMADQEYRIQALITHKLLFKTRPKPIIENE